MMLTVSSAVLHCLGRGARVDCAVFIPLLNELTSILPGCNPKFSNNLEEWENVISKNVASDRTNEFIHRTNSVWCDSSERGKDLRKKQAACLSLNGNTDEMVFLTNLGCILNSSKQCKSPNFRRQSQENF